MRGVGNLKTECVRTRRALGQEVLEEVAEGFAEGRQAGGEYGNGDVNDAEDAEVDRFVQKVIFALDILEFPDFGDGNAGAADRVS